MATTPQHIWIIGASSGIGRELARQYASAGHKLALSARRAEKLEDVNRELKGDHHVIPCDISDAEGMVQAVQDAHAALGHFDKVILLSAIYKPGKIDTLDATSVEQMVDVNLKGAFYTVLPLVPILSEQHGRPQLVLCGSVAGYRGLPNAQPYAATKAGINSLAESLKAEYDTTIDVRVLNPGFVDTPMTEQNEFPMPMMIPVEKAAKAIINGLERHGFEVHFPKRFTLIMKLLRALPDTFYFPIVKRLV